MKEKINGLLEYLISIRHHLHQYPELSNREYQTTAYIHQILEEHQITIKQSQLKTGLVAQVGTTGPIVVLRGDIDALPIKEKRQAEPISQISDVMHACGHDFHTAALVGAAILFKQQEETLQGRILFVFQPAEEIVQGALAIQETGLLKEAKAIAGLHNQPSLPIGTIGLKKEPMMAAVDRFELILQGKGGHAGAPHLSYDPVVCGAQIITASQSLISRMVNPNEKAVLSITKLDGGSTWNVIPDQVKMEGTLRSFSETTRNQLKKDFNRLTEQLALAFQQQAEVIWHKGPPAIVNTPALCEAISQALAPYAEIVAPETVFGGEDFAYYQKNIPSVFAFIGTGKSFDWHSPYFEVADEALYYAVLFYMEAGIALIRYNQSD